MKKKNILLVGCLFFFVARGMEEIDLASQEIENNWEMISRSDEKNAAEKNIALWQKIRTHEDDVKNQKAFFELFRAIYAKELGIHKTDTITSAMYQLVRGSAACKGITIFSREASWWGSKAQTYQFGTSIVPGCTPTLYIGDMEKVMNASSFEKLKAQFLESYKKAAEGDKVPTICYQKGSLFALGQNGNEVRYIIKNTDLD